MSTPRAWATLDPFHEPGSVLGRRVANTQFLRFLLEADPFEAYHFFPPDQASLQNLEDHFRARFPDHLARGRITVRLRRELPMALSQGEYAAFHQSDCILYPAWLAALRNQAAKNIFPITSVTHSLSYADYPGAFLRHLWPGTTARDCIVATSGPGERAARALMDGVRKAYGLDPARFPAPDTARIPLGVDTRAFVPHPQADKPGLRQALGLDPDAVAFLVFGRIQHNSKMDLLPLFRAFQRLFASGVDPKGVQLVLAGWVEEDDDLPATLGTLAANLGLRLWVRPRPTEAEKLDLYKAADVFVSIADNPQETFGLTVAEAMASGLPCLVSDYDGYKDLVEHEKTGLLAPTLGADTTAVDLMAPLSLDSQYHLLLAQQTVVRVPELAESLGRLASSPDLRLGLGEAARKKAEASFAWPRVIESYARLWQDLGSRPVDREFLARQTHPLAPAYGRVFGHYPSRDLDPGDVLEATQAGRAVYRKKDFPIIYAGLEGMVDPGALEKLLFHARKPIAAGKLAARLEGEVLSPLPGAADFLVMWALKHDLLQVSG